MRKRTGIFLSVLLTVMMPAAAAGDITQAEEPFVIEASLEEEPEEPADTAALPMTDTAAMLPADTAAVPPADIAAVSPADTAAVPEADFAPAGGAVSDEKAAVEEDASSAAVFEVVPDDLPAEGFEELPDGLLEEVPQEGLPGEEGPEMQLPGEGLLPDDLLALYAAAAGGSVYAGECGKTSADKVYWMLDSTGETLSIFGRGAMKDLSLEEWTASRLAAPGDEAAAPWLMAAVRFGIKHIVIGPGVTSVGSNCFRSLVNVTDISIADTVKVIGEAAFRSITALTGLVLPDSVTKLGNGVCYGCSALADLTLSANLTSLPEQAFMNCSALNAVTLPAKIENLNTQTFCQCVKLKEVRCLGRDVDVLGPGCYTAAGKDNGGCTVYARPNGKMQTYVNGLSSSPNHYLTFCAGDLKDAVITLSQEHYVYGGSACEPAVTVTLYGDLVLNSGTDYTVTYLNNNSAGTATVRVSATASGIYTGSKEKTFTIVGSGQGGFAGGIGWELSGGVLRLFGSGYMTGNYITYSAPWDDYATGIRSIVIEEGVKSIADGAFYNPRKAWGYTSVSIPSSIEKIGQSAFRENYALKDVIFAPRPASSQLEIGLYAFKDDRMISEIILPDCYVTLGSQAFVTGLGSQINRDTLVLPKNLTIGDVSYVFDSPVKMVYGYAGTAVEAYYRNQPSTRFIYRELDSSHTRVILDQTVFAENGKAHRPSVNVTAVCAGGQTIALTKGTDYTVTYEDCIHEGKGSAVIEGRGLFSGMLRQEFTILSSDYCCGDDLMWSITDGGVLRIQGTGDMWDYASASEAPWASRASEITRVEVGYQVSSIGDYAFASLPNLQSVDIRDYYGRMKRIGEKAFYDTPSLQELIIPSSVTEIGEKAIGYAADGSVIPGFGYCTDSPAGITYAAENGLEVEDPAWFKSGTCGNVVGWKLRDQGTRLILYADGGVNAQGRTYTYSNGGAPWYSYSDRIRTIEVGEGIAQLGSGAFYGLAQVDDIQLPSTLTQIDNDVFDYMDALTELVIPDSVKTIGPSFRSMESLERLVLPQCLEKLGTGMIYNCDQLTSLVIPESVLKIEEGAIAKCDALQWIFIPPTVFGIDAGAVKDLSNLIVYGEDGSSAMQFANAPLGTGNPLTFDFVDIDLSHAAVTPVPDRFIYDGNAKTPAVTVAASGHTLTEGTDYSVSYANNTEIGTGTVTVTGKGIFKGTGTAEFGIIMSETVKAVPEVDRYVYDGKAKKPAVSVTELGTVIPASSYTVAYQDNVNVGTGQVIVTVKAPYNCIVKCSFTISPQPTKLKKLAGKKKKIKVTWNRQTTQTDGYQIMYSTNKTFSTYKIVTVNGAKKTSYTIKGLKKKKKYFIRIRTFRNVGGKIFVSSWSKKKSVKTS